ncbi:hypothetical protein J7T55_011046 [Diaporthe amygdali]|uniref:uncharacterized protein n=1 Tax=Phomopsis amygdali TaxID=1214568 RepID=UPI0022FEFA96|nr:uncharacterized protein J7T55_011046 [Diaporthe amygdali]KAJ0106951.1 hypothetical protein J7T55_011046 [Diaporthe amygdali]
MYISMHRGGAGPPPEVVYYGTFVAYILLGILATLLVIVLGCAIRDRLQDTSADDSHDEEEREPYDLTLTADGRLLNNGDGGRPSQYGTLYWGGVWYNSDGSAMSYEDWLQAVYDPVDWSNDSD